MTVKVFFNKNPDACKPARNWCEQFGTMSEAWAACENPFWMTWALRREGKFDEARVAWDICLNNWDDDEDDDAKFFHQNIIRDVIGDPFKDITRTVKE